MANNPVGLNQVFQDVRNYRYMYSNFSVPFLEIISYLPEFKDKIENDIFELDIEGKLFKIIAIKKSMTRELSFRIEDETISAKDFFEFASHCLLRFEEIIINL